MRFVDYAKERNLLLDTEDRLRAASEREWIIPPNLLMQPEESGPLLVKLRAAVFRDEVTVYVSVHTWHRDPNANCLVGGRTLTGGYFDYCGDPLTQLNHDQLESVAHAKKMFRGWVDGVLEHLPDQIY